MEVVGTEVDGVYRETLDGLDGRFSTWRGWRGCRLEPCGGSRQLGITASLRCGELDGEEQHAYTTRGVLFMSIIIH